VINADTLLGQPTEGALLAAGMKVLPMSFHVNCVVRYLVIYRKVYSFVYSLFTRCSYSQSPASEQFLSDKITCYHTIQMEILPAFKNCFL
jgi:hypothetical protein